MIALYLLIGALALLVTVLLFGFAGCSFHPSAASPTPEPPGGTPPDSCGAYCDWVKQTSGLVAYWRLNEPTNTTVLPASDPIPPGATKTAKDAFNGFDGYHLKLAQVIVPDILRQSPTDSGKCNPGITPGLLEVSPQESFPCLQVDGGFVQVPWDNNLNPQAFTLEAWVSPDNSITAAPQFYYCLVESTGPAALGPKKTGWGIYLGPDQSGNVAWQVWMGNGNKLNQVAVADSGRTQIALTYLALTFDGDQNLQLWVYYPDTEMDIDLLETPALNKLIDPLVFHLNGASSDGMGDFFIGAGSTLFPLFGAPPHRLYPFKGKIQEVALYNTDLSANNGVQEILASHYLAGGNL